MFFILLKYLIDTKQIPIDYTIGEYYLFIKSENFLKTIPSLTIPYNNKSYNFSDITIRYKKYIDKFLYIQKEPSYIIKYKYKNNIQEIKILNKPTENDIHLHWYNMYNIPNKVEYVFLHGVFTEGFYKNNKESIIVNNKCCIF